MENDNQDFQPLNSAWSLPGWRQHKWEKKKQTTKQENPERKKEKYVSITLRRLPIYLYASWNA